MIAIPTIIITTPNKSSSSINHRQEVSYDSLYINPLNDPKFSRSCSQGSAPEGNKPNLNLSSNNNKKENVTPNTKLDGGVGGGVVYVAADKQNAGHGTNGSMAASPKHSSHLKCFSSDKKVLKPSSLQFCMQMNEPDSAFWSKCPVDPFGSENSNNSTNNKWDVYSDSEAAPASSWSTLPNRTLLCRPLPLDIGRCTCVIVKENNICPDGVINGGGGALYSLYTNEGKGRQDRKLAVALCKRRNGKSIFTIAQSIKGLVSNADDSYIGAVTANLMGSKYHVWDQGLCPNAVTKQSKTLLAVVTFVPTITTWTGSYRTMKAYIPKYKSMQLKNAAQVQHINGLPKSWDVKVDKVHQLFSRVPQYNTTMKQYELDFRDRGRTGLRVQKSLKNFQLKLEENGQQTILQLGRVDKSKFVMDYRYPLTGYQAFCMCLASIDSKLCCTV